MGYACVPFVCVVLSVCVLSVCEFCVCELCGAFLKQLLSVLSSWKLTILHPSKYREQELEILSITCVLYSSIPKPLPVVEGLGSAGVAVVKPEEACEESCDVVCEEACEDACGS
jgi:hypothetical protein